MTSLDSFKCARTLKVGSKTYAYYSLSAAEKNGLKGISRLPFSLKVLLENLLRHEDGRGVSKEDIQAFAHWLKNKTSDRDVAVSSGARADAGLHRRAGGGRSRRDARRHAAPRRRRQEDQSAGPGRSGDRPFRRGQFLRRSRPRSSATSRKSTSRTRSATNSSSGRSARSRISGSCRPAPASAIRSIWNICRRRCGARRARSRSTARSRRSRSPIPTPWSAPTRTPRW